MAILTPIIMRKKVHFNTLVRHIGTQERRRQGKVRGDRGRFCVSCFPEKRRHRTVPFLEPSPVSSRLLLILHSVMGRFAVELQGLNVVSVVKKPGDEVFHGFDSILLCIMA